MSALVNRKGMVVLVLLIIGYLFAATRVLAADPVLIVSTLSDGSYTNNPTLNIGGSVTVDSGLTLTSLTINNNGSPSADIPFNDNLDGTYSFSYPLTLSAGANNVHIEATDSTPSTAVDDRTLYLDQNVPTIIIDTPADNSATSSASITVSGTVSEPSDVTVKVNDGSPQPFSNVDSFTATNVGLTLGTNTITVDATDVANNNAAQAKRTVTFDNSAPNLAVTDPMQDHTTKESSFTIKGTVSDDRTTVTDVAITMDGQTSHPTPTDGTFEQQLTFNTDRTYQINVTATNAAGITTDPPVTRNIIRDATEPSVDAGRDQIANSTFTQTGTVSDATALTYQWSKESGTGTITFGTPAAATTTITANLDGTYIIRLTATDAAGNLNFDEMSLVWDTVLPGAPLVTGSTPTSNTRPTWSWSTGGDGNGSYRHKLDDGNLAAGATETVATSFTPGNALSEGSHTLYVQERDDTGNWSASGSFAIVIDITLPGAPAVTGSTPTNNTRPTWSWSTGGSGNGNYRYKLDDGNLAAGATETAATNFTPGNALSEGSHTLYVQERDDAGNWSASGSFTIIVDTVPPDTTIDDKPATLSNSPSGSFSFSATETGATFECSPDGTAYSACASTYNYSSLADGIHTFSVRATDPAGNTGAAANYSWTIDTLASTASIAGTPPDPTNATSATLTIGGNDVVAYKYKLDAGGYTAETSVANPIILANLPEGLRTVSVIAKDSAGNWQSSDTPTTVAWTVDITPPDTLIDGQPALFTREAAGSFSFSSPDATATFECSLDDGVYAACTSPYSFTLLPDGGHSFHVRARDPAGTFDPTPAIYSWTIDTVPPSVNANPSGGIIYRNAQFTQTATASDVTTLTYQWTKQSGPGEITFGAPAAIATAISASLDGSYLIRLTTIDAAGNSAFSEMTLVWDTTKPAVNANPTGGTLYANAQFTHTATATDANPLNTYAWSMQSAPPGGNITFGTPNAPTTTISAVANVNGTYTLRITVTDAAGNSEFSLMTLVWDTVPPAPPVITPSFGQVLFSNTQTGNFKFNSNDANGVTFTCAIEDPDPITPPDTNIPATGVCTSQSQQDFANLAEGRHAFRVTATDPANNRSTLIYTWAIDKVPPVLTFANVLPDQAHTSGPTIIISGTVTDPGSYVSSITITAYNDLNNDNPPVEVDEAGNFTQTMITLTPPNGIVSMGTVITTTARDAAGNTYSNSRTIFYDPNAPKVTITSPPAITANPVTITNKTPINVVGTVDKLVKFQVRVNGVLLPQSQWPPDGTTFNLQIDLAPDSDNTIEVIATDYFNSTLFASESRTVRYDIRSPSLVVTDPDQDIRSQQDSYIIKGAVSDTQDSTAVTVIVEAMVGGVYTSAQTLQPQIDANGSFAQVISIPATNMYRVMVKATDAAGNETAMQRRIVSGRANGDINGDRKVDVADALLALQISVGLLPQTDQYLLFGDVAPLVDGAPTYNWKIGIGDVVVILKAAVGLVTL